MIGTAERARRERLHQHVDLSQAEVDCLLAIRTMSDLELLKINRV